jgi:hypothetical protein
MEINDRLCFLVMTVSVPRCPYSLITERLCPQNSVCLKSRVLVLCSIRLLTQASESETFEQRGGYLNFVGRVAGHISKQIADYF